MGTRHLWMCTTVFSTLATPLELEAMAVALELDAPVGTCVTTVAGGTVVFLLCFNGLAEATSVADGCFKPAFPREGVAFVVSTFFFPATFGHFLDFFPMASSLLFFAALVNS